MQKVGLRAMVIIVFLSLFCFTVHAKECTMIGNEEAEATFVVTHNDGTHSVITYSNGEEVNRTSVGSEYSHNEVVEQNNVPGKSVIPGLCPEN